MDVSGTLVRLWSRKKSGDVKTVRECTYLGNRVSADGGCEVDVTSRAGIWVG